MAVIMDIGRNILERRTDAKSRRMLWHEIVEALHLSLCASLCLDRDDVSVDNCEIVDFTTRPLVCVLPSFNMLLFGCKDTKI